MSHMSPEQQVIFEEKFKKMNETKTSGMLEVPPNLVFQIIFRGLRVEVLQQHNFLDEVPIPNVLD